VPSEKVTSILLSKTDLTLSDVETMSEAQAWRVVYSLPRPTPRSDTKTRACFTGFGSTERAELVALADSVGHLVTSGITKKLTLLVCGANAGPVKMETAVAQGTNLVSGDEYRSMIG